MKRILATLLALACLVQLGAQETQPAPKDTSYWTKGLVTQIGFSQLSLTNWAAGGYGSISLNTYMDGYSNYAKDRLAWDNEIQMGFGFIQQFDGDKKPKKSDDRLILDSKLGFKQTKTLYYSAIFNFRSQFADGFNANWVRTSSFIAPAYASLGLGIDFKPSPNFSMIFAPLTGKVVMVKIPELRKNYGNAEDDFARFELGAQLKTDAKIEVENFKVATTLILFSDYLDKPQNIKVNWDVNVDAKINKYFSVTLRTNLVYDDKVKNCVLKEKRYPHNPILDENGNEQMVPGIQFKELFSVGFSYLIGQKK